MFDFCLQLQLKSFSQFLMFHFNFSQWLWMLSVKCMWFKVQNWDIKFNKSQFKLSKFCQHCEKSNCNSNAQTLNLSAPNIGWKVELHFWQVWVENSMCLNWQFPFKMMASIFHFWKLKIKQAKQILLKQVTKIWLSHAINSLALKWNFCQVCECAFWLMSYQKFPSLQMDCESLSFEKSNETVQILTICTFQ